jgi:hypothetical protein
MDDEDVQRDQELLSLLKRRRHERERQLALYGSSADPSIPIELDELNQKITHLSRHLGIPDEHELPPSGRLTLLPDSTPRRLFGASRSIPFHGVVVLAVLSTIAIMLYVTQQRTATSPEKNTAPAIAIETQQVQPLAQASPGLRLVDIQATGELSPTFDIKVRNTGESIAFLKRVDIEVIKKWYMGPDKVTPLCVYGDVSQEYLVKLPLNADVPYTVSHTISQVVEPNQVDRFTITIANNCTMDVLLMKLHIIYDEDDKVVTTRQVLYMSQNGLQTAEWYLNSLSSYDFPKKQAVSRDLASVDAIQSNQLRATIARATQVFNALEAPSVEPTTSPRP